jgi:hypothetical protein
VDADRVDRYVIEGWVLPFWLMVAGFGAVATLCLFRSIARSVAQRSPRPWQRHQLQTRA